MFIDDIKRAIKTVAKERNISEVSQETCLAQAILETGNGKSKIMTKAHAPFGIKATKDWIRKAKYGTNTYSALTKECYNGATLTTIQGQFRAYESYEDAVRDYFDLISSKRYEASLSAKTVEECITIIKKSGYATSPNYVESVMNVYNKHIKKEVKSSGPDIHQMALDCLKGKYGNGAKRKQLLGKYYTAVQHEVNKLLVRR